MAQQLEKVKLTVYLFDNKVVKYTLDKNTTVGQIKKLIEENGAQYGNSKLMIKAKMASNDVS